MPDEARMLPVMQPGGRPSPSVPPVPPVPPVFEKVALVGLGLIGGSIALAARQVWPTGLVIGVDRKSVLEKAMILHAIDVAADDPVILSGADLVILAAPVRQNIALLETLPSHIQGSAVITDVSSTKRAIVRRGAAVAATTDLRRGTPARRRAARGNRRRSPGSVCRTPLVVHARRGCSRSGAGPPVQLRHGARGEASGHAGG